jgi:hypothetical protein
MLSLPESEAIARTDPTDQPHSNHTALLWQALMEASARRECEPTRQQAICARNRGRPHPVPHLHLYPKSTKVKNQPTIMIHHIAADPLLVCQRFQAHRLRIQRTECWSSRRSCLLTSSNGILRSHVESRWCPTEWSSIWISCELNCRSICCQNFSSRIMPSNSKPLQHPRPRLR